MTNIQEYVNDRNIQEYVITEIQKYKIVYSQVSVKLLN